MKLKYIAFLLILLIGFAGCSNESDIPEVKSKHTLLVYMIASNLGSNLQQNIDDMISVATNKNINSGNLIVFYSYNGQEAELFQIKEGSNGVVTKHHIRDYEGKSAISPEVMSSVIQEVITEFPADSYGMILSSHGTAWLPADYNSMLRSFGEENKKNMEITALAAALPDNRFEYLLFDACSMGSIECLYEFKSKANYIVASPSETMVAGFPYSTVLPYFFESTANLPKVAEGFYHFYENYQSPYGNVSVTKTSELDELANITQEIITDAGKETLYSLPYSELQVLSNLPGSPTPLYDFDDVVGRLATRAQHDRFKACMEKAVISKYATKNIYCTKGGVYAVSHYSGLSFYAPIEKLTQLNEWYKRLEWYKTVYNSSPL